MKYSSKHPNTGRWVIGENSRHAESKPQEIIFQFICIIPCCNLSPHQTGNEEAGNGRGDTAR